MIIENSPALQAWLLDALSPSVKNATVIMNLIMLILEEDKPIKELKNACVDQLKFFLNKGTRTFVDNLFSVIKNRSYVSPSVDSKSSETSPSSAQESITDVNGDSKGSGSGSGSSGDRKIGIGKASKKNQSGGKKSSISIVPSEADAPLVKNGRGKGKSTRKSKQADPSAKVQVGSTSAPSTVQNRSIQSSGQASLMERAFLNVIRDNSPVRSVQSANESQDLPLLSQETPPPTAPPSPTLINRRFHRLRRLRRAFIPTSEAGFDDFDPLDALNDTADFANLPVALPIDDLHVTWDPQQLPAFHPSEVNVFAASSPATAASGSNSSHGFVVTLDGEQLQQYLSGNAANSL